VLVEVAKKVEKVPQV